MKEHKFTLLLQKYEYFPVDSEHITYLSMVYGTVQGTVVAKTFP